MATNPTGSPLFERVKNILLQPRTEWPRIEAEPTSIADIYKNYVMILAAIPAVAGLIGSLFFGGYSAFGVTYRPSIQSAISTALTQYIGALVGCYVIAMIIEALAPTFGGTKNRVQAFKVISYSYTAAWVAGVGLILPGLTPIVALVGLYGLYLLYLGLPVLMKAPADKVIVYMLAVLVSAIIVALVIALVVGVVTSAFAPTVPAGTVTYTVPG